MIDSKYLPKIGAKYVISTYGQNVSGPFEVTKVTKTTFVVNGRTFNMHSRRERGTASYMGDWVTPYRPEEHDPKIRTTRLTNWWHGWRRIPRTIDEVEAIKNALHAEGLDKVR